MHSLTSGNITNRADTANSKGAAIETDGIILDVDGTIWDTTAIVAGAWNDAAAALHIDVPSADARTLRHEFGKTMSDIADDLWPRLSKEDKVRLMAECCRHEQEALSRLNAPGGQSAQSIVFPGVIETVQSMCRTVPFFIVSNCQKGYVEMVMAKTGLAGCITDYECYGNTGCGKAENIQRLVKRNGLSSPIYIGDTTGDAAACREAGVTFVWASYGFGCDVKAEHQIERFAELEGCVKC